MYIAFLSSHSPHLSFGHDAAQFKQLIAFMATVSIVLWACVLVTVMVRMWLCHIWYRRRYRINN